MIDSLIERLLMKWLFFSSLLLFLLAGCSGLPKVMQDEPYTEISLRAVQADFAAYKEAPVRWGGTIISVTNKEDSSQVQLLFYPLSSFGRPRIDTETEGRFVISGEKFIDPAVYKEGLEVTVVGVLIGEMKQQVGEKTLTLPLLSIKHIHLWPERQQYDDRYYPYFPGYYNPYYFPHSRFGYNFYYDYCY